jgi:hypothetical protein
MTIRGFILALLIPILVVLFLRAHPAQVQHFSNDVPAPAFHG